MVSHFQAAVENSPPEVRPQMVVRTAAAIAAITARAYNLACQSVSKLLADDAVWNFHLTNSWYMVTLLEHAHKNAPRDRYILEQLIWMCKDLNSAKPYTITHSDQYKTRTSSFLRQVNFEHKKALDDRINYYEYILQQQLVSSTTNY